MRGVAVRDMQQITVVIVKIRNRIAGGEYRELFALSIERRRDRDTFWSGHRHRAESARRSIDILVPRSLVYCIGGRERARERVVGRRALLTKGVLAGEYSAEPVICELGVLVIARNPILVS